MNLSTQCKSTHCNSFNTAYYKSLSGVVIIGQRDEGGGGGVGGGGL